MANILEIILKAVKQGSGFKDTQKDAADLGKAMSGLNKILGMAGLAIGAQQLIDFGKVSVDAALESATADAALQAALISTGQATAEYRAQLDALATSLENTTMFTDEQVAGAEKVLVTFRNISQNIMPQVITTVADMGQAMGDMGAASELAGKLLDAPAQAAARMQRQGIMLTQQQRDQIATFMEMGNTAGAQGVILDALNTKYGGQAEAARQAAGGMQDWAVATGRLQEEFGKLLLAIGESGVGGSATGLINTLTEGATVWAANVEQIQLFADALSNLNDTAVQTNNDVGIIQQMQKGWEIILLNTANAAIESTVGWDALAESYGTVQEEAAQAEQATREANQAIAETPLATGASAQALDTLAARWQGLANAQRTMSGGRDMLETMAGGDTKTADEVEALKKHQEELDKEQQKLIQKSATTMGQAIKDATKDLATDISSAVSDAVSGVDQNVIGDLMGLENADANAGEAVRRMAAVAGGGIMNEWAPSLAQQLTGVQDKTAQAFVQAFQTGDDSKLKAAAQQLALNPIIELFDAQMIANQVEQKLKTEGLQQALNDKVSALLGEKGLPAVQSVTQQVGDAVTTTGDAATTVGTNMTVVATTAETAMGQVSTALSGTLISIDTVILRIGLLNKALERTKVLAGEAGAAIGGLNPPAAVNGNGVPNEAQRRMGPLGPL